MISHYGVAVDRPDCLGKLCFVPGAGASSVWAHGADASSGRGAAGRVRGARRTRGAAPRAPSRLGAGQGRGVRTQPVRVQDAQGLRRRRGDVPADPRDRAGRRGRGGARGRARRAAGDDSRGADGGDGPRVRWRLRRVRARPRAPADRTRHHAAVGRARRACPRRSRPPPARSSTSTWSRGRRCCCAARHPRSASPASSSPTPPACG